MMDNADALPTWLQRSKNRNRMVRAGVCARVRQGVRHWIRPPGLLPTNLCLPKPGFRRCRFYPFLTPNAPCEDKDARWTKKHGKSFFGYKNLATGKALERG